MACRDAAAGGRCLARARRRAVARRRNRSRPLPADEHGVAPCGTGAARARRGGPRRCGARAAGLGSSRLDARPGGARVSAAREHVRRRRNAAQARPALQRRRCRRARRVLPGPAAVSGPAAVRAARGGGCSLEHARRLRGGRAPQSVSRRAIQRARMEPAGAEGAVHRQRARADRRARCAAQSDPCAHALRLRARALGRIAAGAARAVAMRGSVRDRRDARRDPPRRRPRNAGRAAGGRARSSRCDRSGRRRGCCRHIPRLRAAPATRVSPGSASRPRAREDAQTRRNSCDSSTRTST